MEKVVCQKKQEIYLTKMGNTEKNQKQKKQKLSSKRTNHDQTGNVFGKVIFELLRFIFFCCW